MNEFGLWVFHLIYCTLLLCFIVMAVLLSMWLISCICQIWEYKHNNHEEIRAEFVNRLRGLSMWYPDNEPEAEIYNKCNRDWNAAIDYILAELEKEELTDGKN